MSASVWISLSVSTPDRHKSNTERYWRQRCQPQCGSVSLSLHLTDTETQLKYREVLETEMSASMWISLSVSKSDRHRDTTQIQRGTGAEMSASVWISLSVSTPDRHGDTTQTCIDVYRPVTEANSSIPIADGSANVCINDIKCSAIPLSVCVFVSVVSHTFAFPVHFQLEVLQL